eukprot:TRINITY_DN775829_c0_g1_i1.p1 TRINITY_DN775829_c0_g1~~TRINITY_DN775829_c0_g1_i1.p1  ORF type:complete len:127 (-),score=41.92 TRINITY_DN775829_c0_g1_i1:225-605(-)
MAESKLRGMNKWIKEFSGEYINASDLQKEVDSFMIQFDEEEEQKRKERERMQMEADDDGFVLAKSMKRPAKLGDEGPRKKKSRNGPIPNFYAAQRKEAKQLEMQQLKKQYQADMERIKLMKLKRAQ